LRKEEDIAAVEGLGDVLDRNGSGGADSVDGCGKLAAMVDDVSAGSHWKALMMGYQEFAGRVLSFWDGPKS
jgi:hypothetical protein